MLYKIYKYVIENMYKLDLSYCENITDVSMLGNVII